MNEVWNLDPIYKGFSDPAFEADICSAKELLAEYTAFTGALAEKEPAQALHDGILLQERLDRKSVV